MPQITQAALDFVNGVDQVELLGAFNLYLDNYKNNHPEDFEEDEDINWQREGF